MDISAEKLSIIQRICELQDADLLDLVKNIVNIPQRVDKDWWKNISELERDSIERGINEVNEGKVLSHSEVRQKYEKWLED